MKKFGLSTALLLLAACPSPGTTTATEGDTTGTTGTTGDTTGTTTGASTTDSTTTGVTTGTPTGEPGTSSTSTDATTAASTGADTDGEPFTIGGVIKGDLPNTPVKVLVLWSIDTPMGDGFYKFGAGTVAGTDFSATLPGALPSAATLDGELGVGFAVLVPDDLDIPDGPVVDDIEPQLLGAATNEPVIWRGDPNTMYTDPDWPNAFPGGYACGDCVPAMDMSFDAFAVGACDDLTLFVPLDESTPACNWT